LSSTTQSFFHVMKNGLKGDSLIYTGSFSLGDIL